MTMREPYRLLDLFSGIGGFSLGLERTGGFKTVAFCEIEPFPRKVLAKHWPGVPIYDDVRNLSAARLAADGIAVDAICGGFPCQDISFAGNGAGLDGERSGLWFEYFRLIRELRPRISLIENVAALLSRGLDRVLCDLASIGYDAQWEVISASDLGAIHRRQRLWIQTYPNSDSMRSQRIRPSAARAWGQQQFEGLVQDQLRFSLPAGKSGGVVDGVPDRMGSLKGFGNAVVPQIPELIGRAILASEGRT
jgi:DNA (cytosine-5)-methyltransferase 1